MIRRWTAKAALARSRKNVAGAIERLRAVAHEWGDQDQYIVDLAEEEVQRLESLLSDIEEGVAERSKEGGYD